MSTAANWPQAVHEHLDRVGADLSAKLELGLSTATQQLTVDLEAELDSRLGALARSLRQRPFALDWTTDATADANSYSVLRSRPCPAGLLWDVRRGSISAGGTSGDPFTVLTGATAILVKSSLMAKTTSNLEPQFQLINSEGPVPNDYSFSRGTLVLKAGEELQAIVKGAPTGTLLTASWGVEVHPEEAFREP